MDIRTYRIWLQHALGCGSTKVRRILKYYGSIQNFYEQGYREWAAMRIFTEKELNAMKEFSADHAQFQIEYCEKLGQKIYTPENKEYPSCLRNINNPPGVLYVKGTLPDFDNCLAITVIGARKCTESGRKTAFRIGYGLAKNDAIVVSGGALGGDIAAHNGALKADGVTVCILACGINYPYLTGNSKIREQIAHNGALISEYPPDTGVERGNFQVRNRILSGLSRGLAVVEAEMKSGTMITVRHALDQGKDIFAVPGDVNNPMSTGTNHLIKEGAKMILNAEDILEEYSNEVFDNPKKVRDQLVEVNKPVLQDLEVSSDAAKVYSVISDKPIHISQIESATLLPTYKILAAITELELSGKIISYSGRRYTRSDKIMI